MHNDTTENQNNLHSLQNIALPDLATLKRLAISESGFIFDPETGHSFNVNETGMLILRSLQDHQDPQQVIKTIISNYEISERDAERDLIEFIGLLRKQLQGIQE